MATVDLTLNFNRIFNELETRGDKPTNIAKMIGYTTTTQLNSVLDGSSQLSSKAMVTLIEKLNVSPLFLFLGQGEMFLDESGDSEFVVLQREYQKLVHNQSEAFKTAMEIGRRNKELEKMYADLIEITAAAIKHYKTKCGEDINDAKTE